MFKAFARWRIDLLSAIVINDVVCVVIGHSSSIASISLLSMFAQNWYRFSVLQGGLLLGCTNYGAVYFLIRALGVPGWQSSQLFPTISIAVVGLSSLGAWVVFNERLQRRMVAALTIGIAAIVLVNL